MVMRKSPISSAVVFLAIIGSLRNLAFSPAVLVLALAASSSSSSSPPPPLLLSVVSPLSPSSASSIADDAVIKSNRVSFQQQQQIRASNYGIANNSTVLSPVEAAASVGVRPTLENATKGTWQRAWKLHRFMMKVVLHRFDRCRPGDSKLALACLWWKALSGNDITSPVYDRELSYDLLPPVTRWIVSPRLCRLYPRLHHANVEIRTAYLDKSVTGIIDSTIHSNETQLKEKIRWKLFRLIIMGGGYDTRGVKLLERSLLHSRMAEDDDADKRDSRHPFHRLLLLNERRHRLQSKEQDQQQQQQRGWNPLCWWRNISMRRRRGNGVQLEGASMFSSNDIELPSMEAERKMMAGVNYDLQCYELDLPEVVEAKNRLLNKRLFRRRPWLKNVEEGVCNYPRLVPANFNNIEETRKALEGILLSPASLTNDTKEYDTITNVIVFEGVMIYLDEGIPHSLLQLCSDVLESANLALLTPSEGYLCFADRLENIPGGDSEAALAEMESTGWDLIDWLPKPGLARHMGIARLRQKETTLEKKV